MDGIIDKSGTFKMLKKIKLFFKNMKKSKVEETVPKNEIIDFKDNFSLLKEETIEFKIGSDIAFFIDDILSSIKDIRKEIINETGFIFPQIRIRENRKLQENECIVYIQGRKVYQEFFICNKTELNKELKNLVNKIYDEYLEEIFTNELFEEYITYVQRENAWLVWNISQVLFVSDIKYLLISLLRHNKSIKNISLVFEKMGEMLKNSDRWSSSLDLYYLEFKLNNLI